MFDRLHVLAQRPHGEDEVSLHSGQLTSVCQMSCYGDPYKNADLT
jgi:hypothetical protein